MLGAGLAGLSAALAFARRGRRVVLLGPASYRRFWEADRRFHGMRAELAVERTLPADEIELVGPPPAQAASRLADAISD